MSAPSNSTDSRSDLRSIEDYLDLRFDLCKHVPEASATLKGYVERRLELHAHIRTRTSDDTLKKADYCAVCHCWRNDRRIPEPDDLTIPLPDLRLDVEEGRRYERQCLVFVVVREVGEPEQRVIGCLPSDVYVARLDEICDGRVYAGQSDRDAAIESLLCRVNRELHQPLFVVSELAGRPQTMTYELPGNVVEDAAVIVNGVSESGGELRRQRRPTLLDDRLDGEQGADPEVTVVTFWLKADGWVSVFAKEAACLSPGDASVEVRPLKLDPRAIQGISHAP